jgi:cation diffusion facilitator CzcD-associated flavoprotein CzcO
MASVLDWLIIGGGVHGTLVSNALLQKGWRRAGIRVLDPRARPLALWEELTARVGMSYLRSPSVHNIDLHPRSLDWFAQTSRGRKVARFLNPYERPGIEIFRLHSRSVVERERLHELRLAGRASGVRQLGSGFSIETTGGQLVARRLLLATGASEQPCWPAWASAARAAGMPISHVFSEEYRRPAAGSGRVVVVGGGLTAVQLALSLARESPAQVVLIARHAIRVHEFDSDPGWLGPLHMRVFSETRDYGQRRLQIRGARHRGSVTKEVAVKLQTALETGALLRFQGNIERVEQTPPGPLRLCLRDGAVISCDQIVLATGFDSARPGGAWLSTAIQELGLSCAACGYPIVNRSLEWHRGIFVTGPLAELEVGPISRNIAGAREAALRISAAA